jgi:hypothetical protein
MAPIYTIINNIAKNSAPTSIKTKPANKKTKTSHNNDCIGFTVYKQKLPINIKYLNIFI